MKDKELREKLENTINREVYKCGHGQTDGILITDESFDVKIANAVLDLIQSEVEKAVAEEREVVMVTVEETLSRLSLLTDEEMGDFFVELYSSLDQLRKDIDETK